MNYEHDRKPTSADDGTYCPHCKKNLLGVSSPTAALAKRDDGSYDWKCPKCGGLLFENPHGYLFATRTP